MKKFLLSLALIAASIGAWAQDEVTAKVSGTSLNIGLTNSTEYVAFQMDITLPSGVSATDVAAAANRLTQTGEDNTIGSGKFIVASNVIDATNNVLRVIAYNLNNDAIAGTPGADILNITLSAAVSDPTAITIDNIVFVTKTDLAESKFEKVTGENGTLIGDVNKSGDINLNDVTALCDIILNGSSSVSYSTYDLNAADVNQNGEINLNDLTALCQILLNN